MTSKCESDHGSSGDSITSAACYALAAVKYVRPPGPSRRSTPDRGASQRVNEKPRHIASTTQTAVPAALTSNQAAPINTKLAMATPRATGAAALLNDRQGFWCALRHRSPILLCWVDAVGQATTTAAPIPRGNGPILPPPLGRAQCCGRSLGWHQG